ncbi:MAG: hypothetical protein ACOY0T_22770 [Myxococcota bacterium]
MSAASSSQETKPSAAALAQAAYFLATGIWPIVHYRSFEAVTGPKVDTWLVKTFGALVTAVGAALAVGALDGRRSKLLATLAIGSAGALAIADVVYAVKGRISRVYLVDALAEVGLIAGLCAELNDSDGVRSEAR